MTLRTHSIVHSVIYDDKAEKAVGVRLIDEVTMETTEYFAKIIFLNASAVASTAILMNSKSERFPNGMDESGSLGGYLMDHHLGVGAGGILDTHQDKVTVWSSPRWLLRSALPKLQRGAQKRKLPAWIWLSRRRHSPGLEPLD